MCPRFPTEPENRWILPVGRVMMDPLFLLKYWFPAYRPFCEKCSFFPLCYDQISVIFCALFEPASGKKTIARVYRVGKKMQESIRQLHPRMALQFVDEFAFC